MFSIIILSAPGRALRRQEIPDELKPTAGEAAEAFGVRLLDPINGKAAFSLERAGVAYS